MNRGGIEATRKQIAVLIVVVIIIATIVAGLSAVQAVNQHTMRDHLDAVYSTVNVPGSLQLKDKHFNGRSFWDDSPGISKNMVYTYAPTSSGLTINQAREAIAGALTSAGFSLDSQPDPSPISFSAHGNDVTASVTITGQNDSNDGNAPVQSVQVQVYE